MVAQFSTGILAHFSISIYIRIRKHKDILMPNRNFSFLNFFSNFECILYDCVFNYLWLFYILGLLFKFPEHLPEIFVMGWIIRLFFSICAFGVIMLISERSREEWYLVRYLGLNTFYTGWFLRMTRLIAHTREIFFFSSYKDAWNPRKTSELAQMEGI